MVCRFVLLMLLVTHPTAGLFAQEPAKSILGPHWDVLPDRSPEQRAQGFQQIARGGDRGQVAVLRDLLRFAQTADEWYRILDAGTALLGEPLREVRGPWRNLTLRMAADREWPELGDYAEWKAELYATRIDPRMRRFFDSDVKPRIPMHEIVWGGVEVDGIPSLDDPKVVGADAAGFLLDAEPVFGIALGGEARAYPLRIVDWHEMVNDRVGGVSFALTYCTLCGAGVAYRTEREGRAPFRFGSSELLMRSNKLMFDRETWSLWNQLTGEPVLGDLADDELRLEALPVVLTSWGDWRMAHPRTTVATLETGVERRYEIGAAYGDYFGSPGLIFPAARPSKRARDKERFFVLRVGDDVASIPLDRIRAEGVVRVRVGDQPVVVLGPKEQVQQPIPGRVADALEKLGRERRSLGELTTDDIVAVIEANDDLIEVLDESLLLGLGDETRLEVLGRFAKTEEPGSRGIEASLRDRVASLSLVAPVRAYLGDVDLRRTVDGGFRQADGRVWIVTEEKLTADGARSLPRVPGHLVYGFGFDAFFAGDPVLR